MSTNLKVALQDFIHQYFHQNVTFQDTVKVTGTFTVTVDDGKDEDCHLHEVLHKDQHNCSCNLLMGQDRLRHIKQEVESEDEVTENSNCESNAAGQSLVDTKPFSQAGQASLEDSKKLYSDSMPTSTLWLVKNTETGETITAEETAESNLSVMRMGSLLCDESKEIKPSTSDQAEIDENNSIPTSDGMDLQCLVLDEAAEIKLETEPVMTKNLTSLLEELEASGKVSCDECGYVCSKECELERHKQIHTLDLRIGERRDSCNQFFYQQTENSSQTSSGNQLHYDKPTASACEQEIRSVNSCQESAVSERYRVNTRQKFQRQLINQNLHGTPRNRSFQRHAESIQRDLANNTGCELIRDKANQDVLQDGSKSNLQHISTKNPTQNFHDTSRTESFSELFRHSNLTNSTEGQHFASVNGGSGFNREISNAANRIPNFPEQAGGQSFDRVGNWNYQENLSRTQVSADIYTDSVHGDSNMQNLTENQNFEQGSQQNTTFPPDKTNGFLGQMANWFSGNENYDSGTGNHCFQTESNNTACSRGVNMAAESVSESQSFHCSRCRKCFKSRRGLGKHMSHMHHRSYLYKCDVCRKSFTNKSEFLPHLKYHPCKSKQFMCGDCGKSYLYKKGLDKHFDSCQQKKKISACNFCGKVFTSECQLSDHIKGKHQFPRYQCVCGRRFKWRSSLAYHRQHCLEARS